MPPLAANAARSTDRRLVPRGDSVALGPAGGTPRSVRTTTLKTGNETHLNKIMNQNEDTTNVPHTILSTPSPSPSERNCNAAGTADRRDRATCRRADGWARGGDGDHRLPAGPGRARMRRGRAGGSVVGVVRGGRQRTVRIALAVLALVGAAVLLTRNGSWLSLVLLVLGSRSGTLGPRRVPAARAPSGRGDRCCSSTRGPVAGKPPRSGSPPKPPPAE